MTVNFVTADGEIPLKKPLTQLTAATSPAHTMRKDEIEAAISSAAVTLILQFAAAIQALKWKNSVRVASTANVAIATAMEAGDVIDGITLAAGDRALLKNQTDPKENGIYDVPASGAATRSLDANTGANLVHAVVGVEQGTVNADRFYVCTTNAPITIGSTNIVWNTLLTAIGGAEAVHGHAATEITVSTGAWDGALAHANGAATLQEVLDSIDDNGATLPP